MQSIIKTRVEIIDATATLPVRHEVLRKGKPLETCRFEGDNDIDTIHLGIFSEGKIVAVSSFLKRKNSSFQDENQYQMRGMAVLPECQQHGFGKQLLLDAENKFKTIPSPILLWFNARKAALKFYLKHDYTICGPAFEIEGIGTHFLMFKKFNQ